MDIHLLMWLGFVEAGDCGKAKMAERLIRGMCGGTDVWKELVRCGTLGKAGERYLEIRRKARDGMRRRATRLGSDVGQVPSSAIRAEVWPEPDSPPGLAEGCLSGGVSSRGVSPLPGA